MTIEDAIKKYNDVKGLLGRPPSSALFYEHSGISKRALGKLLAKDAYSKLVSLSGDTPSTFSTPKLDLNKILELYGKLARSIKRAPLIVDWDNAGLRPSVNGIEKSHHLKWSEISNRFLQFASGNPDWSDIVDFFPNADDKSNANTLEKEECFVYLMLDSKTHLYKIGISKTAAFREKTLQSEKPSIRLIAAKKFVNRRMAASIEKALHDSYSHKRRRGEWFLLDRDDISEIKITLNSYKRPLTSAFAQAGHLNMGHQHLEF